MSHFRPKGSPPRGEVATRGFKWCGPEDCGYTPGGTCKHDLCDYTCDRRNYRHAHHRTGVHTTSTGPPNPDGTRSNVSEPAIYIPRICTDPACPTPTSTPHRH
jgi:hypothetical protein